MKQCIDTENDRQKWYGLTFGNVLRRYDFVRFRSDGLIPEFERKPLFRFLVAGHLWQQYSRYSI